jgi:hypothetical protein
MNRFKAGVHPKKGYSISFSAVFSVAFFMFAGLALANPVGPTVVQGVGDIQGLGTSEVTVHQNDARAVLHWQQFNIGPDEVTR